MSLTDETWSSKRDNWVIQVINDGEGRVDLPQTFWRLDFEMGGL
jgi:hypothetical protein